MLAIFVQRTQSQRKKRLEDFSSKIHNNEKSVSEYPCVCATMQKERKHTPINPN
jgi:hypothetical protein